MIGIKIDETKLNMEPIFELTDKDTASLYFDSLYEVDNIFYTDKEFDQLKIDSADEFIFTPTVEYWIDENKYVFVLLFDSDVVDWDISNEMRLFAQKKIAEGLCKYNETGCCDCEFNRATDYNCPLGRD